MKRDHETLGKDFQVRESTLASVRTHMGLMPVQKAYPFNMVVGTDVERGERLRNPYQRSVWVMRAIKEIAGPIAAVPIHVSYQERGGKKVVTNQETLRFVNNPAKGLTRHDFIEGTVGWLKLAGEAFWILDDTWLLKSTYKSPILLARPDRMKHVVDKGELVGWRYTDDGGATHLLLPEQVEQLKYWNPYDQHRGLAEMDAAFVAAESDYLAGKFTSNLMRANGDQGVYVIAKNGIPDDAQREQIIRQLREKREQAKRGDFRAVFLTGDMTIEDPKVQVPDAALTTARLQNRHEIYIAFGVPASMADVQASYSIGSASDRFRLLEQTSIPTSEKISDHLEKLASRVEGKQVFIAFDWSKHSVMRQVRNEQIDSATKLWSTGWPWEKVGEFLGLEFPEFPGSDIGYLPFNVSPVAGGVDPADDPKLAESDPEDPLEKMQRAFALRAPVTVPKCAPVVKTTAPDICSCSLNNLIELKGGDPKRAAHWKTLMVARNVTVNSYRRAFTRVLMQARSETLQKISSKASKATVNRAAAADLVFLLDSFSSALKAAMRKVAAVALQDAGQGVFDELSLDDPFTMPDPAVLQFLASRDNRIAGVASNVHERIMDTLQEGIDAGETMDDLAARVRSEFNDVADGSGLTIAQTETSAAYGTARQAAMEQAKVEYKQWLTSHNANVRPAHAAADAQTVRVDEPFLVAGEELMHPGDPRGSAGNVINCHCVSIAVEKPKTEDT